MFSTGYRSNDRASISNFVAANRRYKILLAQAAGNDLLTEKISELLDRFERYLRISKLYIERHEEMYADFAATIEALSQDGERAKALVQQHLARTKDVILSSLLLHESIRTTNIGQKTP